MRRPALTAELHAEGIVEFHSTSPEMPMTGRSVLLALARARARATVAPRALPSGRLGGHHRAGAARAPCGGTPNQGNANRALCALFLQSAVTAAAVYAALGAHAPKSGQGPVCDVSVMSLLLSLLLLWCVCACMRECDTLTARALWCKRARESRACCGSRIERHVDRRGLCMVCRLGAVVCAGGVQSRAPEWLCAFRVQSESAGVRVTPICW